MILFLDFDGVLRPESAPRGRFHPPCLQRFEAVMRDFHAIGIVISSDWRWRARRSTIVAMFSDDIGARIIGVTAVSTGDYEGSRYREILDYLRRHPARAEPGTEAQPIAAWPEQQGTPGWLALDDTRMLFPEAVIGRSVLLTDPAVGFDARFEARLRAVLSQGLPAR